MFAGTSNSGKTITSEYFLCLELLLQPMVDKFSQTYFFLSEMDKMDDFYDPL